MQPGSSTPLLEDIMHPLPAEYEAQHDAAEMMQPRHTHARIKALARVVFTAALLAVLLMQVNLGHVSRVLRHSNPLAALGACGLMFAVGGLAVIKWRVLLRGSGVTISLPLSIRLTAIAFLWNLILPGGESGTLIRTTMLARQRPGDGGKVWASVVVEHLTLITAQLMVGGSALVLARYPPPQMALWLWVIGILLTGIAILIVLFLAPMSATRLDDVMARVSRALVIPRRLRRIVGQGDTPSGEWLAPLWQGLTRYRGQMGTLLTALIASMAFYATMYAAYWVAARGLGISLGYVDIVWLMAFAGLATHLPVTIAGVGVREGILVFFLTQRHVNFPTALAFSITILALNVMLSIPGLIAQAMHTSTSSQIPEASTSTIEPKLAA